MRLVVRAPARSDLLAIARYSLERWGEEQADRYIADLEDYLDALAAGRKRQREYVARTGTVYLKSRFRAYFVFARRHGEELHVYRLLHERRDMPRHLA